MKSCQECQGGGCHGGSDCKTMSWKQLLMAVLLPVVLFSLSFFLSRTIQTFAQAKQVPTCITKDEVVQATTTEKKCLTIFEDKVYDFTLAKKWDLTGHVGKHLCGKEYDKATIEKGPHPASVVDKFYLTKLCGPNEKPQLVSVAGSTSIWPKTVLGMSWFRFSAYLALFFFVMNFLTCFAMPWSKIKEPWKGTRPGKDKLDAAGRFPLTFTHKWWAWLAIFSLSWHGVLGFACVWFGKCF